MLVYCDTEGSNAFNQLSYSFSTIISTSTEVFEAYILGALRTNWSLQQVYFVF